MRRMVDMTSLDDDSLPLLSPSPGRRQSSWVGLGCVMSVQTLHGIAYYTLVPHILTFGTEQLGLDHKQAISISLAFSAVVYVMPLIGGLLGDTVFGRYKAILTGICFYFIGTLIMLALVITILTDALLEVKLKIAIYIASLTFIAVSRGFVIANIVPFGAEQLTRQSSTNLWSYFMWTFWFFNIGKLIAFLPMPFVLKEIAAEKYRLLTNVVLQLITIGVSAASFVFGKVKYTKLEPQGNVTFRRIRKGLVDCIFCRLRGGRKPSQSSSLMEMDRWYNAQLFRKLVLITGLFATCGIYEAIYFQLTSTYIVQAGHLHDTDGLPDIFMNMFSPLVVLTFVPLLELYNRNASPCRSLQLHDLTIIAIGTSIAVVSPLCAGAIETFTRQVNWPTPEDSGISIFVQVPQYFLIGIADILVFVPGLKFAYQESPRFIQSSCTGLLFGLGSFVGFIIYVIQLQITGSVAHGGHTNSTVTDVPYVDRVSYLETLFYSLGGFVLFALVTTFIPLSILYKKAKDTMPDKTDDDDVYRRGSITWASPRDELGDDSVLT